MEDNKLKDLIKRYELRLRNAQNALEELQDRPYSLEKTYQLQNTKNIIYLWTIVIKEIKEIYR